MIYPELIYAKHGSKKDGVIPDLINIYDSKVENIQWVSMSMFAVPEEYDLILTAANIEGHTGGGKKVTSLALHISTIGISCYLMTHYFHDLQVSESANWSGATVIGSGMSLHVMAVFSGADATNGVQCSLNGVLIPQLNI